MNTIVCSPSLAGGAIPKHARGQHRGGHPEHGQGLHAHLQYHHTPAQRLQSRSVSVYGSPRTPSTYPVSASMYSILRSLYSNAPMRRPSSIVHARRGVERGKLCMKMASVASTTQLSKLYCPSSMSQGQIACSPGGWGNFFPEKSYMP